MRLDLTMLKSRAAIFLSWWGRELFAALPETFRNRIRQWRRTLLIDSDGRDLTFHLRRDGRDILLFETPIDRAAIETTARSLRLSLANFAGNYDHIILRLESNLVLQRDLRLPLAARGSLFEAAGYDIDRQTPFKVDKVRYGIEPLAIDRYEKTIMARLHVVRRVDLDPSIECLAAAGLVPDRIEARHGGPDLIPPELRRRSGFSGGRGVVLLILIVAVLGLMAARLPLGRIEAARAALGPDIAAARSEAFAVEEMRAEIDRAQKRQSELFRRKASEPSVLALLTELTDAAPKSVFLIEFAVERGEVTMSGYASKASELLSLIEDLPDLEAARFLAPVTQEPRVGRERFSLAARIVTGKASGGQRRGEGEAP